VIISGILNILGIDSDLILPSLISSTVLISLFLIGRLLDSIVERKRNSQEWYMKMVLEPNISSINNFFGELLTDTISIGEQISKDTSLENKTLLFEELALKKRKLEFNFILLVSKPYPKTANNLTDYINSTYDCCVGYLDAGNFCGEVQDQFEQDLMVLKAEFFEEIYHPFRFKSFFKWFKKNYLWVFVLILILLFTFLIGSSETEQKTSKQSQTVPMIKQGR
tara:strand:- start:211 stop:879 length:669 start_codon:yes stop_codon:yes gene_type:complete